MTEPTMTLLEKDGSFNFVQRDQKNLPEKLGNMLTYWLIGRSTSGMEHNSSQPNGTGPDREEQSSA